MAVHVFGGTLGGGDYWARAFQGLEVHLIQYSHLMGFLLSFSRFVSRALGEIMENGPTAQYNK